MAGGKPRVPAGASASEQDDELHGLVRELRACATSAETVLATASRRRVQTESRRLRRMLAVWHGVRDENDHDLRMHFTEAVHFFAIATRQSDRGSRLSPEARRRALGDRARLVVARIDVLSPSAAKRLDVAAVAHAIDRHARDAKRDWKALVRAWGRLDVNAETWRVQWNAWRR